MGSTRKLRIGGVGALMLAASSLGATGALASYHVVKISEVHADSGAMGAPPDYVELQMYAGGQNLLSTHYIQTYSGGSIFTTFQFPSNVSGGQSQRTVLIAAGNSVNGDNPDFDAVGDLNVATGNGTVCYIDALPISGLDCVQYGTNFGSLVDGIPSPYGSSVPPSTGLDPGQTLQRSLQPGCESLLEASDDSDDSATDFALGPPSPRNIAAAPSGISCPETTIKKGPGNKTKDRTPSFKFQSSVGKSSFSCKLDDKAFAGCKTKTTLKKLSFGKHTLKVFATNSLGGTDKSPAKQKFTVKS